MFNSFIDWEYTLHRKAMNHITASLGYLEQGYLARQNLGFGAEILTKTLFATRQWSNAPYRISVTLSTTAFGLSKSKLVIE